ncbi:MAG: thiamine pyrophosphate-requiring protein [Halarchaeum sp.]
MTDTPPDGPTGDAVHAGERFLTSLAEHGVERVFANFGTDHTPLIEAAARLRERGEPIPETVTSPHEFAALSAAHGYAAMTGTAQAVIVHVDVGTQNLGAAMHNAHRAGAPVFVFSGLAPVTDDPARGGRDNPVHYKQDVFDQPGIVREYCRWLDEYRAPADPETTVIRGLERANAEKQGPVYVSATRESLEAEVPRAEGGSPGPRDLGPGPADAATVAEIGDAVEAADAPLVVTSDLPTGDDGDDVDSLVEFAERAGAGVVEFRPVALSFPRTHPLHVGFDPSAMFDVADLVVVAGADLPWLPSSGGPDGDATVIQLDADPSKAHYPHWSFDVDRSVAADPAGTLALVADRLDPNAVDPTETVWAARHEERVAEREASVAADREDERLTADVVSATLADLLDDDAVFLEGLVTNAGSALENVPLDRPASQLGRGGAGLGWAPPAAVGVKLARPERDVVAAVGDGSYVFSNPTASAWMAADAGAPTLTVVYNNRSWNAVKRATTRQHPEGRAVAEGVPESQFRTPLDLSAPASAAGAFTRRVTAYADLEGTLREALDATRDGTPAVVDVALDRH